MKDSGRLVCVGLGMTLGSHITPLCKSHIDNADLVFAAVSDGVVEMWLMRMHPDVRSLQPFYSEGTSRMSTYRRMVDAIMAEVRAGKRVCAVFYGHPGVFAWPAHKAIEIARAEGFAAHMEPGVSAEDCLYADLGIDPGKYGCQHYEATQLMSYRRRIDPSAFLIVWQVGIAGDRTLTKFSTGRAHRQLLVEVLSRDYPLDHDVILYETATLPVQAARIEHVALKDLPQAEFDMHATLVIPPCMPLQKDFDIEARLAALEESAS